MKYFILLVVVGLIDLSESKGHPKKEWKQFKLEFNKTYESSREELNRFQIFKENLHNIHKHNKRYESGKETYLQEINRFGDLTDKEFGELYGLSEHDDEIKYTDEENTNKSSPTNVTDDYLDWREAGAVTPAKDQGKCGSCWIFSAIGALESYNFKKTGRLISLSEQNVVDCYSNYTCLGGTPYYAAKYVLEHGAYLETDYPYTAGQDECRNITKTPIKIDFNSTEYTNGTAEDLKQGLKEQGPLSVCLYVTAKWRFYSSGVWYHNKCSQWSNHCVLAVGYGTENGNDYWLFKNSWGRNWGQDGYIKVARNKHEDYCGIQLGLYIVDNEEKDEENEL